VLGHVDHAMRADSAGDARHCEAVAGALDLPIEVVRLGEAPANEAAARSARYEALERMADRLGASVIATGHTLDDDAETVLLRMGRGGFPLGIPPRRGRVLRPLLSMRRMQAAELCAARGVPVLTDPTNLDERFARNRIRLRVLPLLGDDGVLELARLAGASREAKARHDAALDRLAAALVRCPAPGTELALDRPGLAALPGHLREGVLRRVLQSLGIEPSGRLVRDLSVKLVGVPGARLDLPGGLVAWAEPEEVLAGRPLAPPAAPAAAPVGVPGTTRLPDWGIEVLTEVLVPPPIPGRGATGATGATGVWEALLDGAAARAALAVRSRQPGDRYRPLGAPGARKLQDVLVDRKVPRAVRDRVPLLTAGGSLAWVAGHGIAHDFRLTAASVSALRVRIRPLGAGTVLAGGPRLPASRLSSKGVAP
jgi:tRNA(Ile)-lysidine synthase